MSNFTEDGHITRVQAQDLSAKQYFAVTTAANRTVSLATAATQFVIGIVSVAPLTGSIPNAATGATGDEVDIATRNGNGTFKVVAGAAFAFGAYLTVDAQGRAIAATQAAAGAQPTSQVFGYALEAATAAGQVVEFMWFDAII